MAILQLSIWRAVQQARGDVSARGAADAAGRAALDALYPAQQGTIEAVYAALVGRVPDGAGKDAGIALGQTAATAVLAERADDGSAVLPPPYVPTGAPGDFAPTPPTFAAPVFTHWAQVRPFVLASASQFRPEPPPALDSAAYADAIDEVQLVGFSQSTTRTAEQTEVGRFWS